MNRFKDKKGNLKSLSTQNKGSSSLSSSAKALGEREGGVAIHTIYILYDDREYQMKITRRRNFLMSGQSKIFIFDEHISVAAHVC